MASQKDEQARELSALILPEEDVSTVREDYVPDGFSSQQEYLDDFRENYEADLSADDDNRKAALDDKQFVAGEQWDPVVLQQRQGLPCLVINTIPQFIAQLVGDWRENRNAVKVLPAENGDKDVADVRSDLIRSIETKSRAERVYDNAFESMVQCGDAGFRVAVQYANEDVFDQDTTLLPVDDPLSMVWDRLSIDPTGRDARRCSIDDTIPLKEFNSRWPGANPSELNRNDYKQLFSKGWLDDKSVKVTEHWRMIERTRLLGLFEDGSIHVIDDNSDQLFEKHGRPIKTRLSPCRYAQMHLVTGFNILPGPYEWKLSRLPNNRL